LVLFGGDGFSGEEGKAAEGDESGDEGEAVHVGVRLNF